MGIPAGGLGGLGGKNLMAEMMSKRKSMVPARVSHLQMIVSINTKDVEDIKKTHRERKVSKGNCVPVSTLG